MYRFLLVILLVVATLKGIAQIFPGPPLEERIRGSQTVIFGEVLHSHGEWDAEGRNIYTTHRIRVIKTLKGAGRQELDLVVKGGIAGDIRHMVSTSAELEAGDRGFLILKTQERGSPPGNNTADTWQLAGGKEGFVRVRGRNDPDFSRYPRTDRGISDLITASVQMLQPDNEALPATTPSATAAHSITTLSPLTSTAGTGSLLSITGVGFGATQGSSQVWFRHADYASSKFTDPAFDIRLWSDTLIRIIIPDDAATGNVWITVDGVEVASTQILTIRYAHTHIQFKPTVLVNRNGSGGYTWRFHTSLTANPQAAQIMDAAINQWVCLTRVPWLIGETTTAAPGMDGLSTVSFGPLENGIGEAQSWAQAIFSGSTITHWAIREVDIVFKENTNFSFDRSAIRFNQVDFQSVALHELGHAHMLGHVNNSQDLMHYAITTGSTRDIQAVNIECAEYIINLSLSLSNPQVSKIILPSNAPVGNAGTITGQTQVCAGQTGIAYTVPVIANATSYVWTLPPGATATGTANSITVSYGANAVSGNISVRGRNACHTGATSTLAVSVSPLPAQPSAISGNATVCQGSAQTYSVTAVQGVAYTWTFPAGWTQTAGGNTNTVTVTAGSGSGNITVTPSNSCGAGSARTLAVTTTTLPAQPSAITGNATVCQGSTQTYSVTAMQGVTYAWSFPAGWTQTAGGNTNTVTVTAGSGSGNITVTPSNSCGSGTARTLAVTTTTLPAQPSAISGNSTVCQGSAQTYSVTAMQGVTYTWSFPAGWTQTAGGNTNTITVTAGSGSGNITVTPSNSCGSGTARTLAVTATTLPAQPSAISGNVTICQGSAQTYSVTAMQGVTYTWSFPAGWTQTAWGNTNTVTVTAGSGSGNITVTPSNSCGTGTARTLAVTTTTLPAQPTAISGNASVCQGSAQTYSVTAMQGVTYTWSFPAGWTQTAGGNTNTVTVAAGSGSGNITVTPSNSCGAGTARTLAVTATTLPAQPSAIAGNTTACQGTAQTYSVTAVQGVTYTWTFPTGWTQTAGENTNTVTVTAGSGSGNITVTPSNSCGTGTARTLAVTATTLPAQPSSITGNATVCQGSAQTYSVTAVQGVTYTWTFPSGWTQTAGGNTNAVTVTAGSGSGNITVTPSNSCGAGEAISLPVTINPAPSAPLITLEGNTLTSSSPEGNQWYNSSGIMEGVTSQTITGEKNERYYVVVIQNGCTSLPSETVHLVIDHITTDDADRSISAYPNPFTDFLILERSSAWPPVRFSIISPAGQLIYRSSLDEKTTVNMRPFPAGIYFIRFETEYGPEVHKLIKTWQKTY